DDGVEGASRFLNRVWRKARQVVSECGPGNGVNLPDIKDLDEHGRKLLRKLNRTIKKVTNDIGVEQQFNTAIAALMELFNEISAYSPNGPEGRKLLLASMKQMTLMMAPLVPHFSEEVWELLGGQPSVFRQKWPEYDESLTADDTVEFVIQVSGKIRDRIMLPVNTTKEDAEKAAFASARVNEWLKGREIVKKIFVPDKLLNLVVK
ncbi:MAG TPA: class I tRNA ligase family protein, partial [Candidatus Goldiibacteriota bacterium]|nr:class I tRNA ligase family protein [Candidatus Goldiibacteriota bacterium]